MKEQYPLRKESLDALLALFSPDREEAGAKYEKLRRGLVRYFDLKGCNHSDELADETLSRVAARAGRFDASNAKPAAFIYGFASKIYLEYTREPRLREDELDPLLHAPTVFIEENEVEEDESLDRMEVCLAEFSAEDRRLLILYYSEEKAAKVRLRKQLAAELGCDMNALHMRVYRLRKSLKESMEQMEREKIG